MAFDQTTRGRLQKLVNSCRGLLSDEFSIQLQQTYGLDPKTGDVTPMARLTHLDDRERHTAEVLRLTLAHYLGADADDTDHRIAVLDRMVREQAFTVLNRLAALLMMEARGQLIESVSKGYQSRGYQLYSKIAGTALGETGQAYQVYLFSVFDELAQELPALFDRYAASGQLFPRETALRALLDELNHFEIESLWGADETIGWIYQYFNSKEERKAMRDASQAPRNSRELAVRNQFFTPRYVVEFLVDNTLGRLWFNATGGQTDLRDRCQYLLVKPDEQPPASAKVRDPRTLKLLDPACGSMHFGLYAFDLFLGIYREAWAWEQQHGPGSLDVSTQLQAALKPLCQSYEDEATFLRDVPRLIIENNIYGVDIDPRAAQIATLALWLRAQRAWHDASVKAKDRPRIGQGHVVAAIAPPAERDLRKQFGEKLDYLDIVLFEKTLQLLNSLPELGVLLQVEREMPSLIRQVFGEHGSLFKEADMEQWQNAEVRLRVALSEFAQAAKSTYQGHLFVQDALQGLRLIDLCREVFDVVVMNPPFGDTTFNTRGYLQKNYSTASKEIANCFVERGAQLTGRKGFVGAITSRFMLANDGMVDWRAKELLAPNWGLQVFADLGYGVLDDAMVEACSYVVGRINEDRSTLFINCLDERNKEDHLQTTILRVKSGKDSSARIHDLSTFRRLPDNIICHTIPENLLSASQSLGTLLDQNSAARVGLQTGDNERFVRAVWEVSQTNIGSHGDWRFFAKGGEYEPYYDDIHLVVFWKKDGYLIKNFTSLEGKLLSRPQNLQYFFREGITYPDRTTSDFSPRHMPPGVVFSSTGFAIFTETRESNLGYLGAAYTRPFKVLIDAFVGSGDSSVSGSAARHYRPGVVNGLSNFLANPNHEIVSVVTESIAIRIQEFQFIETTRFFVGFASIQNFSSFSEFVKEVYSNHLKACCKLIELNYDLEKSVCERIGLVPEELNLDSLYGLHPARFDRAHMPSISDVETALNLSEEQLIERLTAAFGGGRSTVKKAYFADRRLELASRLLATHPDNVCRLASDLEKAPVFFEFDMAKKLVSYLLGIAFGRWSASNHDKGSSVSDMSALFSELPVQSPAQYSVTEGLLISRSSEDLEKFPTIIEQEAGKQSQLIQFVRDALAKISLLDFQDFEVNLVTALRVSDLGEYFKRVDGFFGDHIASYSKSRRKAPIYWPLATNSGSYTLWVYYPRLSSQTLYTAINDYIEPKLKQICDDVAALRYKGSVRTSDDEKQFEIIQAFELELIELRSSLLKIAQHYQPNHDDGVQISAAPLWQLFRHKPWQKVLKETWVKLEKGEYDWAHLAMAYWPERVREKCKTDKSLAIAHGLEDLYVEPEAAPKKTRGIKKAGGEA